MQYISKENGYYLPIDYNDTKIVLLVRDPYCLFAYWEISNEKRDNFIKQFGEDCWNKSRPVIKLTNVTLGKSDFIEVTNYSHNWYINITEPNCIFTAELGRLFDNNIFVALVSSNSVHTPFDKPLTEETISMVEYTDTKTVKKSNVKAPSLGKYDYRIAPDNIGLSSAMLSGISSESFIK